MTGVKIIKKMSCSLQPAKINRKEQVFYLRQVL